MMQLNACLYSTYKAQYEELIGEDWPLSLEVPQSVAAPHFCAARILCSVPRPAAPD